MRRLLRRALRYGIMLGIEGDILIELAPVVIEQSKFAYPELAERSEYILSILAGRSAVLKTVSQGNAMLADLLTELKEAGKTVVLLSRSSDFMTPMVSLGFDSRNRSGTGSDCR